MKTAVEELGRLTISARSAQSISVVQSSVYMFTKAEASDFTKGYGRVEYTTMKVGTFVLYFTGAKSAYVVIDNVTASVSVAKSGRARTPRHFVNGPLVSSCTNLRVVRFVRKRTMRKTYPPGAMTAGRDRHACRAVVKLACGAVKFAQSR